MKILRITVLSFFLCVINGCMPNMEEGVTLSFWTDNDLIEDGYRSLFINEVYVGDFEIELDSPICSDVGLLNFKTEKSEDLTLSVQNAQGASIEIGVVNLFSVSTGIKIKLSEKGKIYVDQSLDGDCTLVRLNWVE